MIKFTIYGNPITKKNNGRIVRVKGKFKIIPSKQYIKYEKQCKMYMPKIEPITQPVNIKATYYMKTRRLVDLTNLNNALHDILVHYKVLDDDNRDIAATTDGSIVLYDKNMPRTEVEITYIEGYKQWKKRGDK